MKTKKILLSLTLMFPLVFSISCSNDDHREDFENMKKALTFEGNDTYTGYRLYITIQNEAKELIYNASRSVSIDKTNNIMLCVETETTLSNDPGSIDGMITSTNQYYYDVGSKYTLQPDGNYLQEDGKVSQDVPMKLNLSPNYFVSIEYNRHANSYHIVSEIDSSHANDLFAATSLTNLKDIHLEAEFYDNILERVIITYNQNDLAVRQTLNISYSSVELSLPA